MLSIGIKFYYSFKIGSVTLNDCFRSLRRSDYGTYLSKLNEILGPGTDHVYTMNPMKEFVDHHDDHVDKNFDNFVDKHNKSYQSDDEAETKKDTFRLGDPYFLALRSTHQL